MKSLEHRLHLGISLSLVLLFILLWFLGQKSMNDLTHEFVGSRIEHDIESLLAAIEVDADKITLPKDKMPPVYQQPFSGHYFVIALNNISIINSRSLWDQTLILPKLKSGERILKISEGPDNQKLLQISMGFIKSDLHISIALAEDLTQINSEKFKFKKYFFILSLIGLIILLLLQSLILRFSFKRLESVCSDIENIEEGELVKLSENVPTEILPLVQEVNHLLGLLEKRLDRSRNALGNLSHALKGPLNLLFQYSDKTQNQKNKSSNDNSFGRYNIEAKEQLERINQLIKRELKRARLAGKGISTQRFNAIKEVPDLVYVVTKIYAHRELSINQQVENTLQPFADREDMLELIGNLLDNACKWADSQINIFIHRAYERDKNIESDKLKIIVEDDGQPISDEQLASITQRGTRLDESVDGHGLGLSIVNDIVKLYAGTIVIKSSSSLGGLYVCITIEIN